MAVGNWHCDVATARYPGRADDWSILNLLRCQSERPLGATHSGCIDGDDRLGAGLPVSRVGRIVTNLGKRGCARRARIRGARHRGQLIARIERRVMERDAARHRSCSLKCRSQPEFLAISRPRRAERCRYAPGQARAGCAIPGCARTVFDRKTAGSRTRARIDHLLHSCSRCGRRRSRCTRGGRWP